MEIGFDAKRLFNNYTGLGNYSRTLVRNLQEFYPGHTYHLYSPRLPKNEHTAGFLSAPYRPHKPKSMRPFWRSHTIIKDLKRDQIQVYHGLSHQLPRGIERKNIRTVVTIHDLIHKIFPETYASVDRAVYDQRLKFALKSADQLVAISQHTKNDLIKYFNIDDSRISVVYQSCDPLFYEPYKPIQPAQIDLPTDYLLYVGAIAERKNLLNLLTAYGQVKYLPPLVLVGRGTKKYQTQLLKEARRLKIADRLVFLPNIDSTLELKAIYQNSKAFLYPSWYEGFGIPVVEATLCKVPVMTSDTSSLPEAAGPGAVMVNPFDIEHLTIGLKKVMDMQQSTIDQNYYHALQSFDPKQCTTKMMEVYKKLKP